MEAVDIWQVMKWVLLVLLAGFIAQFGKAMAQAIMKKVGKKSPASVSHAETQRLPSSLPQQTIVTPPGHPVSGADMEETPQLATATTDKKLIKAVSKQKKKEMKSLK
jgi:hypothetical protein